MHDYVHFVVNRLLCWIDYCWQHFGENCTRFTLKWYQLSFERNVLHNIGEPQISGHSHWSGKGGRVPHLDSEKFANNREKEGKNQERSGKKRKNWEEKAKIGKVLSLCPSWQKGLAALLPQIDVKKFQVLQILRAPSTWNQGVCLQEKLTVMSYHQSLS